MEIQFSCPHCAEGIVIEESGAGMEVSCPTCGRSLVVPSPAPAAPPAGAFIPPPSVERPGAGQYYCVNPDCGAILYASQLKTLRLGANVIQVCPKCQLAVTALDTGAKSSFWSRLPSAFAYPFLGNGVWMLVLGTPLLAFLQASSKILGIGIGLAAVLATGYFGLLLMDVIRTTVQDETKSMEWPDVSDYSEISGQAGQLFGMTLLIYLPAILCGYIVTRFFPEFLFQPEQWQLLALGLVAIGGFYYPMGLLAVGIHDSVWAVNPLIVVPAIAKTLLQYLIVAILMGLLWALREGSVVLLQALPWGWKFAMFLPIEFYTLYSLLVGARLLGLLYRYNEKKLGWFD